MRDTDRGFTIATTKAYMRQIERQASDQGRTLRSLEFTLIRCLLQVIDEQERTMRFYATTQNYIAHVDQTNGSRRPCRVIEDAGTRARAMLRRLTEEFRPDQGGHGGSEADGSGDKRN